MVPVRRQGEEEQPSFEQVKREAAAAARVFAATVERDGITVEAVRRAERRVSRVLAELRMVAAALADTHTNRQ